MKKSALIHNYGVVRQLLRSYRLERGVKQVDLAKKLGEAQSYISKCETGERRVDLVQLHAFCEALGVSLSEFVVNYLKESQPKKAKR